MSWHCSRALVEEFLGVTCLDGVQSALSSTTPTPEAFYWPDKTTEHSRLSRFGMKSEPLMADRGEELLTWFREVSLAKTSAQPAEVTDSTENEAASGRKWLGLLARFDHDMRSWKTPQCSLLEGLDEYSETWPRWGSMRNGECWERQTLVLSTNETESGLWQTPVADDAVERKAGKWNSRGEPKLSAEVKLWPTPCASASKGSSQGALIRKSGRSRENDRIDHAVMASDGGQLNPNWVEWLMGWPIGLTELKPLETDKYREWQLAHSES